MEGTVEFYGATYGKGTTNILTKLMKKAEQPQLRPLQQKLDYDDIPIYFLFNLCIVFHNYFF